MKKTKLTTTFARLRDAGACSDGYRKLAKHLGGVETYGVTTPINLLVVLDSNGLDDTLWCLRATEQNSDKIARRFAADAAEAVLHIYERDYPGDKRPREAIQAARDYANGVIGAAAWDAARAAARAAARDAAWAAAWDAARAAARDAAWDAARAAARAAARDAAWDAAGAAAWDAARAAARDAAWAAAWDAARDAAWDAAGAAARADQERMLRQYLTPDRAVRKPKTPALSA